MSTRRRLLSRVTLLKTQLAGGDRVQQAFVPLAEAVEVSLSHGIAEVFRRTGRRMAQSAGGRVAERRVRQPVVVPHARDGFAVSIVTPIFNQRDLTGRCVHAIVANTPPGIYELILIDNGSSAPTRRMLRRFRGIQLIRNRTNQGFVTACNQGARIARGRHLLFLNNDTEVRPQWLDALLETIDREANVGAVGAKLVYPDGRLQEAGGIVWNDGTAWNYGHGQDPEAPEYNYVREVDYCSAACLLTRRDVFESLNGFDEQYAPAYYEDTDLCFRLRERGYRVLYQPRAEVMHYEGATSGRDVRQGSKQHQQLNQPTFARRHREALSAQYPPDPAALRRARSRQRGPRTLVIDHRVPQPDHDSGSVRMAAILDVLRELGHNVTFLPDDAARIEPSTSTMQQAGIEVLYGRSPVAFVDQHLTAFDNLIVCRATCAARYLSSILIAKQRPRVIFDTVDLHHLREQRRAALEADESLRRAAERTRAVELAAIVASDMVWVTSTFEADVLAAMRPVPRIEVVPTVHVVRSGVPPFGARRDLLFIGGFEHQPNEDAVCYFVANVFPLVRAQLPEVRLRIVGSHVPQTVARLASEAIIVLGHVPDVAPVFDQSRLSIAPLRYGAGMKGKIGQSLACGVPVVTTPIGAEGMHLIHRETAMIASADAEFSRSIVDLYEDEPLWRRLAHAGREHVNAYFGYDAARRRLAAILGSGIGTSTTAEPGCVSL